MKCTIFLLLPIAVACSQPEPEVTAAVEPLAVAVNEPSQAVKNKFTIPQGAIKGDFNGDGIIEYMWLQKPKINDMECIGECNCIIMFSNPTINSIEVQNCIGGFPTNVGDLNNNGTDEIGFTPAWFTSCWSSYYVWTFKNEDWSNAVDPFLTHCNQWDEGVQPIEKDISKEGNVIVRYSEQNEGGDILTKIKSIKIVK